MSDVRTIGEMFGSGDVRTFAGIPECTDLDAVRTSAAFLGVPAATPYASVGNYCTAAPRAIRDAIAPYAASLHHVDFDIGDGEPVFADGRADAVDCGDLPWDETDFAANRDAIRGAVTRILARGAVPVVVGGDDSVPIPLFQAFEGAGDVVIVQVDAHIDWRDEVQGERWGLSSNMRRASEMAHVKRIVQVGQRAIGSGRPGDLRDARDWGVMFHPGRRVAREGIQPALDSIPEGADVILAIDIDGLDPSIVPGVIGRAPGGLTYWQVVDLIHGVASKGRIAAFSLVEFMPERDVDGLGALVCARLVLNAMAAISRAAAR